MYLSFIVMHELEVARPYELVAHAPPGPMECGMINETDGSDDSSLDNYAVERRIHARPPGQPAREVESIAQLVWPLAARAH